MEYIKTKDGIRITLQRGDAGIPPDSTFKLRLNSLATWIKWRGSRWFDASKVYFTPSLLSIKQILSSKTLEEIKYDCNMYESSLDMLVLDY